MNIAIITKIVLTTVDALIAGILAWLSVKDDKKSYISPVVFILLNIGGMWI